MQTAWRVTVSEKIKRLLLILFVVWSPFSFACQGSENMPGKQIDIWFARDSASISVDQLARMSAWSADMQQFKIVDLVMSNGLAESFEKHPRALATLRAKNVWNALQQFGIRSDAIDVSGRIYEASREPRDDDDWGGQRVEITLSPGCPNHCCDGL